MEVTIDFTDITIGETNGYFEDVCKIMKEDNFWAKKWTIRSNVSITSVAGMGSMELQFNNEGLVYIISYSPSIGDVFYNPDIQAISMWAQDRGWKVPQPHPDLIKSAKDFWKHFYDTLVIDSDYLDKLYGKRHQFVEEIEEIEDD